MGEGWLSALHSSHPHLLAVPNRAAGSCLCAVNETGYRLWENWLVWGNAHGMDHAVDDHSPGLV